MDQFIYDGVFILAFILFSVIVCGKHAKVKTQSDFSVAGRSLNANQVSWVIIGTLVGGVSTIGTVQTAFDHGVTAWIFTLGSGISCFILGCFFAVALRREEVTTVSELLGRYFGSRFRYYSSFFNSLGMFIHIIAQYLAAMAILNSVFHCSPLVSLAITMGLIAVFVASGGITGAGMVGKIKFFLLYAIMIVSALLALHKGGGFHAILARLPEDQDFLNFFSTGIGPTLTDVGAMITGVLSTQIYLQAVFSAKDIKQARNGAFLSALVIPPVGVLGIVVGLYLRAYHPEIAGSSAQALPYFFKLALPPAAAAFCSAVLLLVVLGTGAGLVLGVTTNLYMDGIKKLIIGGAWKESLGAVRICTLCVIGASALIVLAGLDSAILEWSYLSMGLRGAAVFAGLVIVVFFKGLRSSRAVAATLYLLPILYLAWEVFESKLGG